MPSDSRAFLFHVRDNILLIGAFVEGLDFEAFCGDRRTVYAVTRALEIVSEASRRLPSDLKNRHANLPWADIAGAGNIYRHDYEDVRDERLWTTVKKHLPPLLTAVELELNRYEKDS